MAATGSDDDATATFKGDMEKDFGQEAKIATAKGDDAEASGKTSGKAIKEDAAKSQVKEADGQAEDGDDAAKNRGKDAEGEAGSDEKAFVSPEEPMKSSMLEFEARVAAIEAREAGKDFQKFQDARAQAKRTGAGAKDRTTSQRIKPGQLTMTPEMSKMIDDEVEKRLKERLNKDEPQKEVRKRLNFQSDDEDFKEFDRQQREAYDQRLELTIQADEKKRTIREDQEQKKMEEKLALGTCMTIIKSGINKGKACGCQVIPNSNGLCSRHYKLSLPKNNTEPTTNIIIP
jgi:hypothetical protein